MTFSPEILDELLKDYHSPEDLLGSGGILKQLTAALVERCLEAEMKTHLEEQKAEADRKDKPTRNRLNGHSQKTIKGEFGEAQISIPATATVSLSRRLQQGSTYLSQPNQRIWV